MNFLQYGHQWINFVSWKPYAGAFSRHASVQNLVVWFDTDKMPATHRTLTFHISYHTGGERKKNKSKHWGHDHTSTEYCLSTDRLDITKLKLTWVKQMLAWLSFIMKKNNQCLTQLSVLPFKKGPGEGTASICMVIQYLLIATEIGGQDRAYWVLKASKTEKQQHWKEHQRTQCLNA